MRVMTAPGKWQDFGPTAVGTHAHRPAGYLVAALQTRFSDDDRCPKGHLDWRERMWRGKVSRVCRECRRISGRG